MILRFLRFPALLNLILIGHVDMTEVTDCVSASECTPSSISLTGVSVVGLEDIELFSRFPQLIPFALHLTRYFLQWNRHSSATQQVSSLVVDTICAALTRILEAPTTRAPP